MKYQIIPTPPEAGEPTASAYLKVGCLGSLELYLNDTFIFQIDDQGSANGVDRIRRRVAQALGKAAKA